jgi:hypothetical protein
MATFVVEDGSVVASANSYITVADADTYFGNYGDPATWSDASDDEKQEALRLASQYIDSEYGDSWQGARSDPDQVLDWPRYLVYTREGWLVGSSTIPRRLKDAICELALRVLDGITLHEDIANDGTILKTEVKIGPITDKVEYVGGSSPTTQFPKVKQLIQEFLEIGFKIQRS